MTWDPPRKYAHVRNDRRLEDDKGAPKYAYWAGPSVQKVEYEDSSEAKDIADAIRRNGGAGDTLRSFDATMSFDDDANDVDDDALNSTATAAANKKKLMKPNCDIIS